MGENKDCPSNKLLEKLKILVEENSTPNQIVITSDFKDYTSYKINHIILKYLKKVWEPSRKVYLDICTNCKHNNPDDVCIINEYGDSVLNLNISNDFNKKNPNPADTENTINSFNQPSRTHLPIELQSLLSSNFNTIIQNIEELHTQINTLNKFVEENTPQKKKEFIEVLSKMLGSNSHKKSINLNKKIEEKVIKRMEEKFGIKNNFSKAINTALFLSLYE